MERGLIRVNGPRRSWGRAPTEPYRPVDRIAVMPEHETSNELFETDPRFPSGGWTGFFLQRPTFTERVTMSLSLWFREGRLDGEGRDRVGRFLLRGHYETGSGEVVMQKRYLGQHEIFYRGYNDPGLGIWGTWTIRGFMTDGFHIWPEGMADPTKARRAEEADAPAESGRRERERTGVPV